MKSLNYFKSILFIVINSIFFINPFVISWGNFPQGDFIKMGIIFTIVLIIQLLTLKLFKFNKKLEYFFFILNYIDFVILLQPTSYLSSIFLLLVYIIIIYIYVIKINVKPVIVYMCSYTIIMFAFNLNNGEYSELRRVKIAPLTKKATRNIYIIGIDGMVSEKFYIEFYSKQYELSDYFIEKKFFKFDYVSAGKTTLESYAKLINYDSSLNDRYYKKYISNKNSNLMNELNNMNYKKQFIYMDDYFGIDESSAFDEYFPKKVPTFSFYTYINPNWAFPLKYLLEIKNELSTNQFSTIKQEIEKVNIRKEKWVSISHIWYPGHTNLQYNSLNKYEYNKFKQYYINTQKKLILEISNLTNLILKKDNNAVIVYWGDHGSYLLRNSKLKTGSKLTNRDLSMDSTSVLIAVYPYDIGLKIKKDLISPELLFKTIIEKSND